MVLKAALGAVSCLRSAAILGRGAGTPPASGQPLSHTFIRKAWYHAVVVGNAVAFALSATVLVVVVGPLALLASCLNQLRSLMAQGSQLVQADDVRLHELASLDPRREAHGPQSIPLQLNALR